MYLFGECQQMAAVWQSNSTIYQMFGIGHTSIQKLTIMPLPYPNIKKMKEFIYMLR